MTTMAIAATNGVMDSPVHGKEKLEQSHCIRPETKYNQKNGMSGYIAGKHMVEEARMEQGEIILVCHRKYRLSTIAEGLRHGCRQG